jgi:hypothetical protein
VNLTISVLMIRQNVGSFLKSFSVVKEIDEIPSSGKRVSLTVDTDRKYTICFGVVAQGRHVSDHSRCLEY